MSRQRLILGTAQLGSNYGITNKERPLDCNDVGELLRKAKATGFTGIDTSPGYGCAEKILGSCRKERMDLEITTKMSVRQESYYTRDSKHMWEEDLLSSLKDLEEDHVGCLLVHRSEELQKDGSEYLYEWLERLKERGIAKRIGVSVYTSCELELLDLKRIDEVQGPYSVYDQRMRVNGMLEKLERQGIAFNARSIFLQGLIVVDSLRWPKWTSQRAKQMHKRYLSYCHDKGKSALECAVGHVKGVSRIRGVIVGVASAKELGEIGGAWNSPWLDQPDQCEQWSLSDDAIVDPRFWPKDAKV